MEKLKTSVSSVMSASMGTLCEQWEKMKQWNPVQRSMLAVIVLLLMVNVVMVVHFSVSPSRIAGEKISRRSLDQGNAGDEATGAIYIRWGRTECPDEAKLVYEGVVGGELNSHTGGGANYVCLPLDPEYDDQNTNFQYSWLYGTEYEQLDFVSGKTLQNHNVPCAVCQSLDRRNVLMLPAKNTCYPGWHLEYNGYLVTEDNGNKHNKNYECLDHQPEADQAGYRDEVGAQMFSVGGSCGALPCPPYVPSKKITCAVCTK